MNIVSIGTTSTLNTAGTDITFFWTDVTSHLNSILKVFAFAFFYANDALVEEFSRIACRTSYFELICALKAIRMARQANAIYRIDKELIIRTSIYTLTILRVVV
jgi:hypothetical protein